MPLNLDAVVALMREVEQADAIDWAMLNIGEDEATRLLAISVIEHYEQHMLPMAPGDRDYVIVAAIAKLTLENFVLNLRLAQALGGHRT